MILDVKCKKFFEDTVALVVTGGVDWRTILYRSGVTIIHCAYPLSVIVKHDSCLPYLARKVKFGVDDISIKGPLHRRSDYIA